MKLLLFLVVVLFGLWLWRRGRTADAPATQRPTILPEAPHMVQCLHCQIHLPPEEAMRGLLGPYCSAAHRSAAGDRALEP